MSIVLTGAFAQSPGGSPAIGMLVQVTGQVFVMHGKAKAEARLADLLFAGDAVVTEAGEAVVLYCPSSERLSIPKNTGLELGASAVKVIKGSAPKKSPAKCLLPRVALGAESLERMGVFRARGFRPISQYTGGPVTTDRPNFMWGAVEGAVQYHLVLKDPEKDIVLWETQTTSSAVIYPEALKPLGKGTYDWEISAEAGGQILAQGMASIEVKPNSELAGSQDGNEAAAVLRALEFENAGYYAEAAALFRKIRGPNTEDPRLSRHLAWLYWNAGLIEAFNEEMKRLIPR